jgi:hypothetical protein
MRSRILRSIAPLGIIPCSTINSRYGAFLNSSSLSRLNSAARSISSRSSTFGDFLDASNHANLAALATLQQSTTQAPLDCTCNCARFRPAVASDGHQHRERPARPAGQQPAATFATSHESPPPPPPATTYSNNRRLDQFPNRLRIVIHQIMRSTRQIGKRRRRRIDAQIVI